MTPGSRPTFPIARRYDTRFLLDGSVEIEGGDVELHEIGGLPWPVFRDMITSIPHDVGEQAFAHYLIAKDQGKPLTAIPAFPSRFFPHYGFVVNRRSGIEEPRDLVGKKVGVLGFGANPAVWMRGILTHQYDVPVERIVWVEDVEDPLFGDLAYPRSKRFQVERVPGLVSQLLVPGRDMRPVELLERGEIDALIAPAGGPPRTERTRSLFADPAAEIRGYAAETGVFPINTVITLRQSSVERYPELPKRLLSALHSARRLYNQEVAAGRETDHMGIETGLLRDIGFLPDDYGLAANRAAVRMMIQYCYEQGVIRRLYEPEDLFVVT